MWGEKKKLGVNPKIPVEIERGGSGSESWNSAGAAPALGNIKKKPKKNLEWVWNGRSSFWNCLWESGKNGSKNEPKNEPKNAQNPGFSHLWIQSFSSLESMDIPVLNPEYSQLGIQDFSWL